MCLQIISVIFIMQTYEKLALRLYYRYQKLKHYADVEMGDGGPLLRNKVSGNELPLGMIDLNKISFG